MTIILLKGVICAVGIIQRLMSIGFIDIRNKRFKRLTWHKVSDM